jgi:hypothetical protein
LKGRYKRAFRRRLLKHQQKNQHLLRLDKMADVTSANAAAHSLDFERTKKSPVKTGQPSFV